MSERMKWKCGPAGSEHLAAFDEHGASVGQLELCVVDWDSSATWSIFIGSVPSGDCKTVSAAKRAATLEGRVRKLESAAVPPAHYPWVEEWYAQQDILYAEWEAKQGGSDV